MEIACAEPLVIDSEWGFRDNRVDHESAWEPVVLCVKGLRSGRRLSFWRRDPHLRSFFRDHANDTFVAHNVVAEMKYLLRLGIPLPTKWFDTYVALRYLTNQPGRLDAGLVSTLVSLGLPSMAPIEKKETQQRILHLRFDPDSADERRSITEYCLSDCDGCGALFNIVEDRVPASLMTYWVEYLKAVARMELRGIPFDVESCERINAARPVIRSELMNSINRDWPVFVGESFKRKSFLRWCRHSGIEWPVKASNRTGTLYQPVDNDTMKEMECRHPFIADVRQVRKTIKQLEGRTLTVDPLLRRHFYNTCPFRSVTGRNQPRGFVFGGPKWMRFLIVPESPDHVLVYVDYTAQEIGIAAALSGDPAMRAVYAATDCHMDFAIRAGAAPPGASKATHPEVRKRYKAVNLGAQYGQTGFGIASRLGISCETADRILSNHKALFPTFWWWSERLTQGSFDRGWIKTPCGWKGKVPLRSNERTWMNWPMQATGADIMRLTVTYLDRQNVRVLAPVHDGFLLSCRRTQLTDLRAAVDFGCSTAVEQVLPGFPLRWDVTVYENDRLEDEDGLPIWQRLNAILGGCRNGTQATLT